MSLAKVGLFLCLALTASAGNLVNPFILGSTVDADAAAYFTRASITDAASKTKINSLVVAMKSEGIWTSLTDMWIVRPLQQNTSGTTVYALKSNANNATLVGGPAYGATGLQYRAQAHVLATPIVQTMNHDWTAGVVFNFHGGMPAGYPRMFGPTTGSGGPGLMYFVSGSTLAAATVGSFSVTGNFTKALTQNIGVNNHLVSCYTPGTYQVVHNGTALASVAGTHGAASHTVSIGYNSNLESIFDCNVYLVYLYSTARITNTNVANLHTTLKATVCSDLSLP